MRWVEKKRENRFYTFTWRSSLALTWDIDGDGKVKYEMENENIQEKRETSESNFFNPFNNDFLQKKNQKKVVYVRREEKAPTRIQNWREI